MVLPPVFPESSAELRVVMARAPAEMGGGGCLDMSPQQALVINISAQRLAAPERSSRILEPAAG